MNPVSPQPFDAKEEFSASSEIGMLLAIMRRLRTPELGCQWDIQQSFSTIAPYTIEEAYEVADAIARNDLDDLKDELGDLLLQVVFHAAMAEEQSAFDFGDVISAITAKMIRRHPHVFTAEGRGMPPDQVKELWARIKAQEKAARVQRLAVSGDADTRKSILADVPLALPALVRGQKLQEIAARKRFDWNDPAKVVDKIIEECRELQDAQERNLPKEAISGEIGDILFSVVNLARHLGVDAEAALDMTNRKFSRRFAVIETALAAQGRDLDHASLDEMEALWQQAKQAE